MAPIKDHPLRLELANELHARPFPSLCSPAHAVFLAVRAAGRAHERDRAAEIAHLTELLRHYGAPNPEPGATHYSGKIGRYFLKWESHSEFVTFLVLSEGQTERPFDPAEFEVFPADWLEATPGSRITSALIRVEQFVSDEAVKAKTDEWFVPEALAVSRVLDNSAIIAGDFRIDPAGHMRLAMFTAEGTGPARVGRILQRLCEIETYKTMAMLGLNRARALSGQLLHLAEELGDVSQSLRNEDVRPEDTLARLLDLSSELEHAEVSSAYRFGATGAYEAIVNQRISILRETQFHGRQTFGEFMMRRFDPAMRTVKSTESQLHAVSERARRTAELLRTQIEVARSAQNQQLLASMDRRADMQLRLQQTVEGLSVVAISYYAVNLVAYMAYPLTEPLGLSKGVAMAIATPMMVISVWLMVRRIRHRLGH